MFGQDCRLDSAPSLHLVCNVLFLLVLCVLRVLCGKKWGLGVRCNINAQGKALRLVCGIVVVLAGLVLLVVWAAGVLQGRWLWVAGLVLLALGLFQVFEACCGWCALRALGFRTPV